MKVPFPAPVVRWFAAVLLAVAAHWAIAPRAAEAKCGDYVHVGGRASNDTELGNHAPDYGLAIDALPATTDSTPVNPGRDRPCSGPSCSSNDQPPLEPAPNTSDLSQRDWGVLEFGAGLVTEGASWVRSLEEVGMPFTASSSLFRPPRS